MSDDKMTDPNQQSLLLRVGRALDNDIVVPDRRVSRYHLEVQRDGDAWRVQDLGSGNGTLLNGESIETAHAREGDTVRIGGTDLRLTSNGLDLIDQTDANGMATICAPAPTRNVRPTATTPDVAPQPVPTSEVQNPENANAPADTSDSDGVLPFSALTSKVRSSTAKPDVPPQLVPMSEVQSPRSGVLADTANSDGALPFWRCTTCGRDVAPRLPSCPRCGTPDPLMPDATADAEGTRTSTANEQTGWVSARGAWLSLGLLSLGAIAAVAIAIAGADSTAPVNTATNVQRSDGSQTDNEGLAPDGETASEQDAEWTWWPDGSPSYWGEEYGYTTESYWAVSPFFSQNTDALCPMVRDQGPNTVMNEVAEAHLRMGINEWQAYDYGYTAAHLALENCANSRVNVR